MNGEQLNQLRSMSHWAVLSKYGRLLANKEISKQQYEFVLRLAFGASNQESSQERPEEDRPGISIEREGSGEDAERSGETVEVVREGKVLTEMEFANQLIVAGNPNGEYTNVSSAVISVEIKTTHIKRANGKSQNARLFALVKEEDRGYSTLEINKKVYGDEQLNQSRIAARVGDVNEWLDGGWRINGYWVGD